MKNYLFILLSFIFLNTALLGQSESDTIANELSISGSVDVYFRANLGADYDVAPGTSFANLPGFALGMANVVLAKDYGKVGFVADGVFGPRGEDATFLSPELRPGGNSSIVNQLYAYWNVSDKVTLTIGNFNTFLGYEVISPTANFNYSTSYMFSYGPFSHTGLKADFDLGSGFSLMAGVFNPTDATEYNPSNNYATGLQLGYSKDAFSIYFNYLGDLKKDEDADRYDQLDITAGLDATDKLYLGLNTTIAFDRFFGIAGYVQYQTSDNLKLGVRVESFEDKSLTVFGIDETVLDVTLTASYSVGDLTIIPEFRIDSFGDLEIVPDGTDFKSSLSSFVLAAVYGF